MNLMAFTEISVDAAGRFRKVSDHIASTLGGILQTLYL